MPPKPTTAKLNGPYSGTVGHAITADPTASTAQPGSTLKNGSIGWGDGDTSQWVGKPAVESHVYQKAGSFTVVLTVWDTKGRSSTASTAATIADVVIPPPDPSHPQPSPVGLSIELRFPDRTVRTFRQDQATDVGDYVGPFVHQKCFQQRQGDWTVFFRPDANGLRDEVVIELGTIRAASVFQSGPHTATISKNGVILATRAIPAHWWWGRWRWQSAPRPFVRTAAELIASKAVLPYDTSFLYGYPGWTTPISYSPMTVAGLDVGMAEVGDRPDIGPLTEPQSAYLLDPTNTVARDAMIAQAEAAATMPIHFRDELTGALFNVQDHPYYSAMPGSGAPRIASPDSYPYAPGTTTPDPNYFRMDAAHTPSLAYLPYLLTDDPYYLEELQSVALFHIVWSGYHQDLQKLPGLVYPGETRAFAWGVRSVGHCAYATPATVPSWLNTKAYWLQNLADNRTYIQRYMDSPARIHQVFRTFTNSSQVVSFMSDYVGIALAWLVRLGFSEWATAHAWFLGGVLPMVSDGSGWDKCRPAPYILNSFTINQTPDSQSGVGLVLDTSMDSVTPLDWAAMWQQAKTGYLARGEYNLATNPGCSGTILPGNVSPNYAYWRAADLRLAVGLGLPGAAGASTWLDTQVPPLLTAATMVGNPKFAFGSGV